MDAKFWEDQFFVRAQKVRGQKVLGPWRKVPWSDKIFDIKLFKDLRPDMGSDICLYFYICLVDGKF